MHYFQFVHRHLEFMRSAQPELFEVYSIVSAVIEFVGLVVGFFVYLVPIHRYTRLPVFYRHLEFIVVRFMKASFINSIEYCTQEKLAYPLKM